MDRKPKPVRNEAGAEDTPQTPFAESDPTINQYLDDWMTPDDSRSEERADAQVEHRVEDEEPYEELISPDELFSDGSDNDS
jgi:hypothetical protein